VTTQAATRWSDDAFLNALRFEGDAEADECVNQLAANSRENYGELFKFLSSNAVQCPDWAPTTLGTFFEHDGRIPMPDARPADRARLARGEDVFMTHACCSALTLLAMSLPAGYGAPNLARVLGMSNDLQTHTYKRLLGVLQMVVNVTSRGGFEPAGKAIVTAAKLRLLHAGVRRLVRRRLPDYEAQYGVPVNHEDMLATIMGFSLLVIRGLQKLGVPLTDEEAEDYYYLWRVFALAMGIHPPGAPTSTNHIPASLTEADEFYAAYARRHYRSAAENPEGVALTGANLQMLAGFVDKSPLRMLGITLVPRIYMQEFLGADGLVQRGVKPVRFHAVTQMALLGLLRIVNSVGLLMDRNGGTHFHEQLSDHIFQGTINRTMHGEVTFLIPEELADLRALTDTASQSAV
jgi:hypothetical protein